jgi:hypothetical protein
MAMVVFLVTDVLFGMSVAAPVAVLVLAMFVGTWFVIPLWRKATDDEPSAG